MRDRAPVYREHVLNFDALRLVALREGHRTEATLAKDNEREMLIRAPAHVHSAHAALCCWSTSCSLLPARSANWLDDPCLVPRFMYLGSNYGCLDDGVWDDRKASKMKRSPVRASTRATSATHQIFRKNGMPLLRGCSPAASSSALLP